MKSIVLCVAFTLLKLQILHSQNTSSNKEEIVNVGVYISPPFIMEVHGRLTGMSIELWEHTAAELELKSNYKTYATLKDIVKATQNNEIDIAVTNLTISSDRAKLIDFTQPWYDAGLRIMIYENKSSGISDLIKGLNDAGHIKAYLWIIFIILLVTICFTLFDRKFDKEFPSKWREGIAESFYSVMLIVTSGSLKRKNLFGWIGRVLSAFWLVIGLFILAYLTSSITSVMTTLSLSNNINTIEDVYGKKVAVFTGSISENFVREKGIDYESFANIDAAVSSLKTGKVAAIIGDAPVLEYYDFNHKNDPVRVVGNLFRPDKYGFGLTKNSPLTKPITISILKAHENDYIKEVRTKYFGSTN